MIDLINGICINADYARGNYYGFYPRYSSLAISLLFLPLLVREPKNDL